MSELAFTPRWSSEGFLQDRRFAGPAPGLAGGAEHPDATGDPVERARGEGFAEGYARGLEEAQAAAQAAAETERAARAAITLSLARLDAELAESLREKLRATVEALCEAMLLPHAIEPAALAARVERAVAMFQRADDERVLMMHPDDLDLLADQLPPALALGPDPAMERGSIRVETTQGGVEDGPAQWRQALSLALGQC